MNTDNNNLETNLGSESLGGMNTPINNEPVNNMGEETFSPFQDLNNAPLNVPTGNVESTPTPDFQTEPSSFNPTVPADTPVVDANVETTAVPSAPTSNVDVLNDALNPDPVQNNNVGIGDFTPSFDTQQTAPTIDSFEPVQSAPVEQSVSAAPDFSVNEPASAPAMGIGDAVMQNTTQMPTVDNQVNTAPTIPIPDQMPTTDYQAGVSTPVDYATPMSDFDQIGTTPELDPNAKGKKKTNKFVLVLLLLIIVGGLGYGAYYAINVMGILDKSSVEVKTVTAEKGEALSANINDYATFKNTSSSNCVLNTQNVNINTVGTYTFKVTCGKKSYTGKVTVKDTKAPEITVKTNIVIAGTTLTPEMLIASSSEEAKYDYAAEEEVAQYQTAGLKRVKVNVSDASSNTKTYYIPVVVTSSEYSMGIVSRKDVTADNTDAKITEKNVILYNNSGGNVNDTSYTAYIIQFNNSVLYKEAIKSYDNSGVLTYKTYQGTPIFNSNTNTLILVKDINSDLIKEGFNETFSNLNGVNGYQTVLVSQVGANKELLDFEGI